MKDLGQTGGFVIQEFRKEKNGESMTITRIFSQTKGNQSP
jgi:hypothetical protein